MDNNSLIALVFLLGLGANKNKDRIQYSDNSKAEHVKLKPLHQTNSFLDNLAVDSKPKISKLEPLEQAKNFLNDLKVNPQYTANKIDMIKKIGPYFPEEYIPLINTAILNAERVIKINEVFDFLKESNYEYVRESIPVRNNKDRINKIIKTIQSESSNSSNKDMGMLMDLVINMDKYKKMFSALSSVMNSKSPMDDPDKLIELILPLLGEDEKNQEKIKEMGKMLEIMKVFNTSQEKKENEKSKNERNKVEVVEKHLKSN